VSVETGISPAELAELDGAMFDAVVKALDERWTPELELAAELVELESALLSAYVRAHTPPKRKSLVEPIQVERPAWVREAVREAPPDARPLSVLELSELVGKRIEAPRGR
jgi:hypothetical protein